MAVLTFDDVDELPKSGVVTFDDVPDAPQPDMTRQVYRGVMNNVAKPINEAVSAGLGYVGEGLSNFVTPEGKQTFSNAVNYVKESPVGVAVGEGVQQIKDEVNDLSQYNSNLKDDLSAFGQNAQLAANLPILKPVASVAASAAKPVASYVGSGVKNRAVGVRAFGREQLDDVLLSHGDATSGLYKAVDATGASLKPNAAQSINANVLAAIDTSQINPAASPKTIGAVKELYNRVTIGKINPITGAVTQAPLSVSELDGYRKLLSNISGEDAVVANKVRDAIDSSLNALSPTDFNGGGIQAAKLLVEARASAAKGFKLEQIADIIKKADGNTIAIKRGFKKLIDQKDWERGFTPDEIKAIKKAAQYGVGEIIERGLGTFGFDLGKTKNVALPLLTGTSAGLGVPGGAPLIAAGTVTRQTGKLAARGKAQNVFNTIKARKYSAPTTAPVAPPFTPVQAPFGGYLPAPTISVNSAGQAATQENRAALGSGYKIPNPTIEQFKTMPPEQQAALVEQIMRNRKIIR
jgi:hypothetical protein